MYRTQLNLVCSFIDCPHASGGVPPQFLEKPDSAPLSPREWGCTERLFDIDKIFNIVPTRVGVYRRKVLKKKLK